MKTSSAKVNVGLLLLAVVIIASVGAYFYTHKEDSTGSAGTKGSKSYSHATVVGPVGSEKLDFLADPSVVKILQDRYALTVTAEKAGSMEMVEDPKRTEGKDFAWPSSQVALELFKTRSGSASGTEIIFNSPIVLYTWEKVSLALEKAGIVQNVGGTYFITDFPKLISMIQKGQTWKGVGLDELYGPMSIHTTDPNHSNSGMMFCGLLADMVVGGHVVTEADLTKATPPVKDFFGQLGMMPTGSADLFSQFITQGMGSNPIIAGYENQLVEFVLAHPEHATMIKQQIRLLYPKPTVWSNHPLIALSPNGVRFLEAMKDPDIQKIAWETHGFRSGMAGVQNDPKVLKIAGIPDRIETVIQMPKPQVMQRLLTSIAQG